MSYDLQSMGALVVSSVALAGDPDLYIESDWTIPATPAIVPQSTPDVLRTGDVVFHYDAQPPILSRVRVKRPDGTWATVVRVTGVHIQMPDGTWQVIN